MRGSPSARRPTLSLGALSAGFVAACAVTVFRIPRRAYEDGSLELQLRDPGDPSVVRSMQVL